MPKESTRPGPAGPGRQAVELAGLRRRLASMLYECLLLLGVLALTFMVPLLILGAGTNYTPPGGVLWLERDGETYHQAYGQRAVAPALRLAASARMLRSISASAMSRRAQSS